jgi:hypothetical protein
MFRRIIGPFSRWIGAEPRRSERKSQRPRPATLRLELLEDRVVPAVTASVTAGVLSIVGDAGNNNIIVQEIPASGASASTFRVDGDGVKLSGATGFQGVTSITIDTKGDASGGAGVDQVFLVGDATANNTPPTNNTSFLTGGLTITGAGTGVGAAAGLRVHWGDDAATAGGAAGAAANATGNFNVNGAVSITETGTASLAVFVGGDPTATAVAPTPANNTMGTTTIAGGTGGTQVTLDKTTTVNGGLTATLGTNAANFVVVQNGSQIIGNESITSTGTGDNVGVLAGSVVTGNLTYSGTAANSSLSGVVAGNTGLTVNASLVGGNLSVTSGTAGGADTVNITGGASIGQSTADPVPQGNQTVFLNLGGGNNVFNFTSSVINGNVITQDAGNDTVAFTNGGVTNNLNRVAGFVSLNNTGLSSTSKVTVSNASVGIFLSIVSGPLQTGGTTVGGNGNDSVLVNNTSIGTAATNQAFQNNGVDLGGGNDTINYNNDNIVGTWFSDSATPGGGGVENITGWNNNNIGFDAKFNYGTSAQVLMTGGAETANHVNDGVFITSGVGNDHLEFTASTIGSAGLTVAAGAENSAALTTPILLDNNTVEGAVSLSVTNSSATGQIITSMQNSQIDGALTYNASGSTFRSDINLTGTRVNGAESLTGGSGADVITDAVSVGGAETITEGNGGVTINIGNAVRANTVTMNTGSGADTFNIAAVAGTNAQFFGAVSITDGAGNDTINLGNTAATGLAEFFAPFTLTRGAGTDTLNEANAQYFSTRTVN